MHQSNLAAPALDMFKSRLLYGESRRNMNISREILITGLVVLARVTQSYNYRRAWSWFWWTENPMCFLYGALLSGFLWKEWRFFVRVPLLHELENKRNDEP